ncbi:MAG: hypothetical protein AB7V56_08910 [Candidatus Nitrosocosmicus sp.]
MSYLSDVIVFISDYKFMVRLSQSLRRLGIIAINCNKNRVEIEFRGEDYITIYYPKNLDHLPAAVEKEIRLLTPLYESNIQTIRYHIYENLEQIKQALEQINK